MRHVLSGNQNNGDVIDLRELVNTLLRWKWVIVASIVATVMATVVLNVFVLTPIYESTVMMRLAHDRDSIGVGGNYGEFADSPEVLASLAERLQTEQSVSELDELLDARVNQLLLIVTARGSSAEQARQLATAWMEVFLEQVFALARRSLSQQVAVVQEAVDEVALEVNEAEDAFRSFENSVSLPSMELELDSLQRQLAETKRRRDGLLTVDIPVMESNIDFLKTALQGAVSDPGGPGEVDSLLAIQFTRDLVAAQTRLNTLEREAELLGPATTGVLQIRIDALTDQIAQAKNELDELSAAISQPLAIYSLNQQELSRLLSIEDRVSQSLVFQVVASPVAADAPIAPNTSANLSLAAAAAFALSIVLAFSVEWYRSEPRDDEAFLETRRPETVPSNDA